MLTPFSEHLSFCIHIQPLQLAYLQKGMSLNAALSTKEPTQESRPENIQTIKCLKFCSLHLGPTNGRITNCAYNSLPGSSGILVSR